MPKTRVLFVCIHNSARSQMAGAFLRQLGGDRFEVETAGLEPGTLNPLAVEAMREGGIDISGARTQSVFELFKRPPSEAIMAAGVFARTADTVERTIIAVLAAQHVEGVGCAMWTMLWDAVLSVSPCARAACDLGPTMPSGQSPDRRWNDRTASRVRGPKVPSTLRLGPEALLPFN